MSTRITALALLAAVLTGAMAWGEGYEAITRPSDDVTLAFVRPGRVGEVLVAEGDEVKKDQMVVRQDDEAELAQLAQLKAEADETVRIEAAEAQLEQKRVDHKKLEEAYAKRAVAKWDVEHARLEVTISELRLKLSKFEREQAQRKYEETRLQVERMKLRSPVEGIVEKVMVKVGESADALEDVMRIVKVDPLWIEVPVPVDQAHRLSKDSLAKVLFKDDPTSSDGKVILIPKVADAASDTLMVRVELPNKMPRPAGEHVTVTFPQLTEKP